MLHNQLTAYVNTQLNNLFPDGYDCSKVISDNQDDAMSRLDYSLKKVKLPGYMRFSHLQSDLYAQYLYFLSNSIWINSQDKTAAEKIFYLNKALHGFNCMYNTVLPKIFLLIHCVGTVLGKAEYSDYFVACHNVTIGSDKGFSPVLSEGVYMGPGSSIVGKCGVGSFTHMAINSVLMDQHSTGDCVIIGSTPNQILKPLKRNLITGIYFEL
ncbi:MAG TPA: hypothetical protein PK328_02690 [Chitinophagaceae bacterium]|nr:hypothetical protein [Chitinophagaceae bacterium]